ncbi:hypothetical protein M011DRAFT_244017 [Sporormia fimetaria CBS 119925]|uniref:Uncharacterized protein n=1 Tax=Sporormia fimetaria CBS 119925 TaxID=1340428 RepID=A0A6A6VMP3_9PLEO|nr:hypothetical protein M011DRAFT_244017 [Sporormia fimetaria CBS 119925]
MVPYSKLLAPRTLSMMSCAVLGGTYLMVKSRAVAVKRRQRAAGDYSVDVDRSAGVRSFNACREHMECGARNPYGADAQKTTAFFNYQNPKSKRIGGSMWLDRAESAVHEAEQQADAVVVYIYPTHSSGWAPDSGPVLICSACCGNAN